MDVEELARLGRRRGACPYYAARAALPEADLVLLPYAALLAQARHPHCPGLSAGRLAAGLGLRGVRGEGGAPPPAAANRLRARPLES
jgi:hypothetical protein